MKKITMIVMPGCPYCANAKKALAELTREGSALADVPVEMIDEVNEPDKASPYGDAYYYVPSLFMEGKKLYEASPSDSYDVIYHAVEKALQAAK
jgi:glutaredoxin 3